MHDQPRPILVVEDDALLRGSIVEQVEATDGFRPVEAGSLAEAAAVLADPRRRIDAVLLDLGLPDGDGRELCRDIRRRGHRLPVLMLTGADAEEDVVRSFEAGADDYIVKPFRPAELLARLRAQLRAFDRSGDAAIPIGPWQFRPAARTLTDAGSGKRVALTDKESSILRRLYHAAGAPVGRTELLEQIWGYSSAVATHTLETHIYRVRRKLERDPAAPRLLLTAEGGYRLDMDAVRMAPA